MGNETYAERLKNKYCEKCESECYREEVDVDVGYMFGPWGCPSCGWSESPEYDRSEGTSRAQLRNPDRVVDQWGCSHTREYLEAGISRGLGQEFYDPESENKQGDT